MLARLKNATCNLIKSFKDEANTSLITKISLNFFLKFWLKLFNPQNYKILIFKVILQFQNLSGSFYSLLFENINLGANFCKKKKKTFSGNFIFENILFLKWCRQISNFWGFNNFDQKCSKLFSMQFLRSVER